MKIKNIKEKTKYGNRTVKTIYLEQSDCISMFEEANIPGSFLKEEQIKEVINYDGDVYKPDGSLLIRLRKNIFPKSMTEAAYEGLKTAAKKSLNRGLAAGHLGKEAFPESMRERMVPLKGGLRYRYFRKDDGVFSNTNIAAPVDSGIAGYFDNTVSRFPYCRATAFTLRQKEKYEMAIPLVQEMSRAFEIFVPERYANQKAAIDKTKSEWVIPGSVFTTLTINKNYHIACHQDAGDLKNGFGHMAVFRRGHYEGCYTGYPKYKVGVDSHEGDYIAFDVHEYHATTDFKNQSEDYERISVIFYYREKMCDCGSLEQEEQKRLEWESRNKEDHNKSKDKSVLF